MTSSDYWDEDSAQRYDAACADMFAPEILGPAVDVLAEYTGAGRALEFAIGTGRVGIPLRERGIDVVGIELSEPMVAALHRKAPDFHVAVGDMATTRVDEEFSLVSSSTRSPICGPRPSRSSASAMPRAIFPRAGAS